MGQWMMHNRLKPDCIVSSPATRAKQTITSICDEMGISTDTILWDRQVYLASLSTLLEIIKQTSDNIDSLMLVGHNPGLEELLIYLSQEAVPRSNSGKIMATATLAHLELQQGFRNPPNQSARLVDINWPRQLPDF